MTSTTPFDPDAWHHFGQTGWQTAAAGYHDWLGSLTATVIGPLLDAARVDAGTRLLDVATGPGYAAAAAAERGARAIGVDFAAGMVAEARRRFPGVPFGEVDAEALPFPDRGFDAVVINFSLHLFGRPEQALSEACRVLAPGGHIAFTVWDYPQVPREEVLREAVEQHATVSVSTPVGPSIERFSNPEECRQILRATGFVRPSIMTLALVQRLPDPDAYFDTVLAGTSPRHSALLRAQPPETLDAIRSAVRSGLRAYEHDGVVDLPSPALLVSAVKP